MYMYIYIVKPDIQTIHRCSHTSIHTTHTTVMCILEYTEIYQLQTMDYISTGVKIPYIFHYIRDMYMLPLMTYQVMYVHKRVFVEWQFSSRDGILNKR